MNAGIDTISAQRDAAPAPHGFCDEILRGLAQSPKRIAPKFFYDETGCQLFEEICRLDEYYLTRTEISILRENATEICQALREFSEVSVEKDQAIVCIVGDNLRYTPGVAARAFGALQGINIRMISQGASLLNLGFVVAARDAEKTVTLLHQEFFRCADPTVFD